MIEKIHGDNISVYKHREKTASAEEFVLNENSQVKPGISEKTGVMNNSRQNDLLTISPDYQAVKNLTETAAELADKIKMLSTEKLSEVRRKVQDGFYLNEDVLSLSADQMLASEFRLF